MMKSTFLLLVCVSYASASSVSGAWDSGKTYHYQLQGRSLSAMHQLAHQYSGILLRGKVDIAKKSDNIVSLTVVNVEYADLHQNLTDGWETEINDRDVNYQNMKLNNENVDVYFKNGAVSSMTVNGNLKEWQANVLKAIVSLIQVDLKGENAVNSKTTQIPTGKQAVGFFRAMEDTVSGKCLTTYTIAPLQKYMIQANPQLVPHPTINGEGSKVIQIVKAKNYSDCDALPRYNFGFASENNYEPASSRMGNLLSRASLSRVTITAESMENYTVQSSVATEQVIVAPNMYNNLHGLVATRMNLTLASVSHGSPASGSQRSVSNPKKYSNLVYDYNPASSNPHAKSSQYNSNKNYNYNQDENSSSSSSSEENYKNNNKGNKYYNKNYNSTNQYGNEESSNSSSSSDENDNMNPNNNYRNNKNYDGSNRNKSYNNEYNNQNHNQYENNYNENQNYNEYSSRNSGSRRSRRSVAGSRDEYDNNQWNKNEEWNQNQPRAEWNQQGLNDKDMEYKQNNNKYSSSYQNYDNDREYQQGNKNYDSSYGKNYENQWQGGQNKNFNKNYNASDSSESSSSSSSENGSGSRSSSSSSSSSSSEYSSSSSSSSLSSSEEDWQSQANINEAPYTPLMPYFIAAEGNSVQSAPDFDVIDAVEKLSMQIANEVKNSEPLSLQHTMSKYIILSRLVETMNAKQMQDVAKRLYVNRKQMDQKNSENVKKLLAWETYKHAVGSAGTGSALETIKKMIENEYMKGERAAEIVSRLPKVAKMPNQQYMDMFFSMVKSPVIQKQQYLNSTAILAFSELLRMTQVSNSTAHMRYALHTYGPMAPKSGRNMYEKYLPYLEENMKNAISNNYGHKIQIYIRALGKTAHPRVLAAFEDYLEGKKQCSQYQRFLMVHSLYHMAQVHPHLVRPVLLKLYQNYAEEEAVRVVAVNIIMATNPSAEVLQMLAMSTNNEPSRGVKSAIITGIESAADNPRGNQEFTRNAQAARHFLKPKDYGQTSSKSYFFALEADDVDATYENFFSYIRSEDHFIPKSASLSLQENAGGIYEDSHFVAAMTSTVNKLFEKLNNQFVNKNKKHYEQDRASYSKAEGGHYWNAEKIAKTLGVKIPSAPEVEATLILELFGGKRVFALCNSTIDSIPQWIKDKYRDFKNSPQFEFTSMYYENDIHLGFPTPMGLPFLYSYTRPVMVHLAGEAYVRSQPDILSGSNDYINIPQQMNMTLDVDATFSTHTESKFGIVAPFNHHKYMSGLIKHIEMNSAFKSQIDIDTEANEMEIKVKPEKNRKQAIFVYKTVPYTTKFNLFDLKPSLDQSGSERIHVDEPVQVSYQLGKKSTGMAFRYYAMSERSDEDEHFFDFSVFNFNRLTTLPYPMIKRGVHPNHVSLFYDHNQSSADAVKFRFAYKYKFTHSGAGSQSVVSQTLQSSPNFQEAIPPPTGGDNRRRQEFLSRVSEGIPECEAHLIDVAAEFENPGQANNQFMLTATVASSDLSPVTKALFYYGLNPRSGGKSSSGNSYEVCTSTKGYFPRVPEINMDDAMKANPNSTFHANIAFGRDCKSGYHFDAQAILSQSEDYRENMQQNRMVKLCRQHIQKGEALSDVCQNATQSANQLDNIKVYVNFNWDGAEKGYSYQGESYRSDSQESSLFAPMSVWLNRLGVDYVYKNKPSYGKSLPRNKVEFSTQFSEDLDYVNVTVLHGGQETTFTRAFFDEDLMVRPYYIAHWLMNSIRFSKEDYMNLPSCSLSEKSVNTFDNATYSANFGSDWHTALLYTPKHINPSRYLGDRDNDVYYGSKDQNIAIIVRSSNNGKEVQLILGNYVVELKPNEESSSRSGGNSESGTSRNPSAQVAVNGRPTTFSSERIVSLFDDEGYTAVKFYAKPNGEVTVKSEKYGLTVRYYGNNVDIYAAGYFKDNVRGLCGTYDGNKYNDFTTPRNCILRNPQLFAASYALAEGSGSSKVKQMQMEAANVPCYKDTFYYVNVISEAEAGRPASKNYSGSKSRSSRKYYGRYGPAHGSRSQDNKNAAGSSYDRLGNSHYTTCTNNQVKYIEYPEDNTVCFSINPIPKCRNGCSPTRTIEKEEPFLCMEKRDNVRFWMEEIENGKRVHFGKHSPNKHIKVSEPESCKSD